MDVKDMQIVSCFQETTILFVLSCGGGILQNKNFVPQTHDAHSSPRLGSGLFNQTLNSELQLCDMHKTQGKFTQTLRIFQFKQSFLF